MQNVEPKVYTVSTVNRYIKMVFEKDNFLNTINIMGEISNFKAHYSGHLYFNLKDEASNIKCVMFKGYATRNKIQPKDGMKVIISGSISAFERDGTYQVYCTSIFPVGEGELYKKYEMLKKKLEAEGLFDSAKKKKIPFLPKRVGVITSRTGAVIQDIINVSTRRYKNVNLLIYPASVQGANVADTVISGIRTFNRLKNVDVIIIARGGGSYEDLFGFNDERLAREIYNSEIPIVSAVGHETDFTICDFVADLRAPTPSAAAELVYPEYSEIVYKITQNRLKLQANVRKCLEKKKRYVELLKASKLEKKPLDLINNDRIIIDSSIQKLENCCKLLLEKNKAKCGSLCSRLDALSPLKTLMRGYSVVENVDNKVIKSVNDVNKEDKISIILNDGKISAEVL